MIFRTRKSQQVQNTHKTPAPATAAITKSANDDELVNTITRAFQEKFEVHERTINDMRKSNMELRNNRLDKRRKSSKFQRVLNLPRMNLRKI